MPDSDTTLKRMKAMAYQRPSRPRQARPGFSLLELLIGMAIFTTAFLMILGVFPTSARSIHQARTVLLATHAAQQLMEQYVMTQSFANVQQRTSGTADPVTGNLNAPVSVISMVNGSQEVITFNWQISVTNVSSDLKDVRCQVWWSDIEQPSSLAVVRYANLETQVANP